MGKPLSVDLRDRVVKSVDGGMSRRQAAARFGVSISSDPLDEPVAADGRCSSQAAGRRQALGADRGRAPVILGAVEEKPDITLAELRELLSEYGVAVAVSTLWRFFARRKITLKKSPRMRRSRTVPTS